MSGGTPVGSGYMRLRQSQGYASSGDDIEGDACSRPRPLVPPVERTRGWVEILENVTWIVSAVFFVYYGDQHSNLIYLLCNDNRIKRLPLCLGMVGLGLNVVVFFYKSMLASKVKRFDEKWDLSSVSMIPFITLPGLVSFCFSSVSSIACTQGCFDLLKVELLCRFSVALWPIWSFLFTLFMACMVIIPHIMLKTLRSQDDILQVDQDFWNSSEKQYLFR